MATKKTAKKTRKKTASGAKPKRKRAAAKTKRATKPKKAARAKKPKRSAGAKQRRTSPKAAKTTKTRASKATTKKTARRTAAARPAAPANSKPAPGTATPLARKDIEQFRAMLLEKRAQLLGDVDTLSDEALKGSRKDTAGDLSSMPIHMADLGTDNYELEFTLGLIESGRAVLQEIDEALERIRQGTYGICLATGRPIGKARLRAQPWAKYCYEYVLARETGKPLR